MDAKTITWSGFLNEVWTYSADTLDQTVDGRVVFEVKQDNAILMLVDADFEVKTSAFDITQQEWLLYAGGAPQEVRILCNPTDLFPYSFRKKATGEIFLSPFTMRRKKLVFQPDANQTLPSNAGLLGNAIGLDNTQYLQANGAVTALTAPFARSLVFPAFNLALKSLSGFIPTIGLQLPSPFSGLFSVAADNKSLIFTAADGEISSVTPVLGDDFALILDGHNVLLKPQTPLDILQGVGENFIYGASLTPGKYNSQEQFRKEIESALQRHKMQNGSTITVTSVGSNLEISTDGASGLEEKVCLLSDRQAQPHFPGEKLKSANRWLSIDIDQTLATTFTCGPVILPRDINSLYLHSDTLAGFRDTMGPVPNTRGTIAKISLGNTKLNEYHSESLYRPHLYSTLPFSTVSRIDFALRDSRGVAQSLDDTNFAFVVTFDTSHLAL